MTEIAAAEMAPSPSVEAWRQLVVRLLNCQHHSMGVLCIGSESGLVKESAGPRRMRSWRTFGNRMFLDEELTTEYGQLLASMRQTFNSGRSRHQLVKLTVFNLRLTCQFARAFVLGELSSGFKAHGLQKSRA